MKTIYTLFVMKFMIKIIFDDKFVGIGKVAGDSPVIILNGFSKVQSNVWLENWLYCI